jgi:MurNAc alpha-1-phosphate uridylyltransferase
MRAMILAAGRGLRMGPLTTETPKPLIKVAGHHLIEYSLHALKKAGIHEVVINVSYHAAQIKHVLGDGEQYGVNIYYSYEEAALETGGGIFQALPLLGDAPFLVLSSDIITDYPLHTLPREPEGLAHLVLVNNPTFHPLGDFCLAGERIYHGQDQTLTFGNIGVYRPELFQNCAAGRFRLGDLLKAEISNQRISGEHYRGLWNNVGTPEELAVAANSVASLPIFQD